jgi:hypothetical protein
LQFKINTYIQKHEWYQPIGGFLMSAAESTRFKLGAEQAETYHWLKTQNLNCDDNTLNYWARTYSYERLRNVIQYVQTKQSKGWIIRNIGGWIQNALKKDITVINSTTELNKCVAKEFSLTHKWFELKFYELYIRDLFTNEEVSLAINPNDFKYALQGMYRRNSLKKTNLKLMIFD